MGKGDATKVFPIPGRFVNGESMTFDEVGKPVAREVESKAEADRLVATGGFALSHSDAMAAAFSTPEATPASTDNVKELTKPGASDKKPSASAPVVEEAEA